MTSTLATVLGSFGNKCLFAFVSCCPERVASLGRSREHTMMGTSRSNGMAAGLKWRCSVTGSVNGYNPQVTFLATLLTAWYWNTESRKRTVKTVAKASTCMRSRKRTLADHVPRIRMWTAAFRLPLLSLTPMSRCPLDLLLGHPQTQRQCASKVAVYIQGLRTVNITTN